METPKIEKVTPELVLKHLFLQQYAKGYFSINPVFSGFNEYLKVHCNLDPRSYTDALKTAGLIESSGRKTIDRKSGRVTKSIIFWLTKEGQTHFGIRPPTPTTESAKGAQGDSKPITRLIKATADRFNIKD